MNGLIIIGIISALFATSMFTTGNLLQKRAIIDSGEIKTLIKNKHWLGGLFVSLLGVPLFILSQDLIGIGFTQMLMAFGMIVLALICKFYLKEEIGRYEYTGILSITIGIILLGLSRISSINSTLSGEFFRTALFFYSPFYLVSLVILCLYKWVGPNFLALSSGILFGNGAGFSQMALMSLQEKQWYLIPLFGSVLVISSILGTIAINIAFKRGRALTLIPILNLGNYLLPVASGLIVFKQRFTPEENLWFYFIPSVVFTMTGVLLLTKLEILPWEKSSVTSFI